MGKVAEKRGPELAEHFEGLEIAEFVKAVHAFSRIFANKTVTLEGVAVGVGVVSPEVRDAFTRLCTLPDSQLDALIEDGARACGEGDNGEHGETT